MLNKSSIKKLIEENYRSVGKVIKVDEIEGSRNNINYKIISLQDGEKKPFFFRKFKYLKNKEKIHNIFEIMDFCNQNGAKVLGVIRTNKDELILFKDGYYSMFEFIDGEKFNGNKDQIKEAARNLAILHRAFYKCNIKPPEANPFYNLLTNTELNQVFNVIAKKDKSQLDRLLIQNKQFIKNLLEEDRAKQRRINKNEIIKQTIHRDFHIENALFRGDKLVVILDFDSIKIGERMRDIAFSCFRFSIYKSKDVDEIEEKTELFIQSYNEVNKLNEGELRLINYYIRNEALQRISYILRKYYFEGEDIWADNLEKHLNHIKIVSDLFTKD